MADLDYKSAHTGTQLDRALQRSLNPDTSPKSGSSELITSGGVKQALEEVDKAMAKVDGNVSELALKTDEKLSELDSRTDGISKEVVETEEESIVIEDKDGNVVAEITPNSSSFKNLKSNGKNVLTEHQDISNLATKEELESKQDAIDGVSKETTTDDEDCIEFVDDLNEPVAKITKEGIRAKKYMDIHGNPISVGSNGVCFVAPNGNDSNSGADKEHPIKTINNGLEKGFVDFILLGGVYAQEIDLSNSNSSTFSIKGEAGANVIFKKSGNMIANDGREVLVSGYSKVYKLANVSPINYGTSTNRAEWLFFDNMNDVSTYIDVADAHPSQRGQKYRSLCTRLVHTTATSLTSACAEIESATDYRWFYDSSTSTLYFNRAASTSTYNLYKSGGNFFTTKRDQSIVLSNIEFRYGVVNLCGLNVVNVYNCAAKYVYGMGAFLYDNTIAVTFHKCEAAYCFDGVTGDGFNAHAQKIGDSNAKVNQCNIINCWSHDNNDDGYSDHEFGETFILGGLFEYNGKAGVTPSYGSHCECHDVLSRYNWNGFVYSGAPEDGGNNGQLICYNCISKENNRGETAANATNIGFLVRSPRASVEDTHVNHVILYNCVAISEKIGFSAREGCVMDTIDCRAFNCTTVKSVQNATMNVINSNNLS